jgi:serine/threonine-protein kinase
MSLAAVLVVDLIGQSIGNYVVKEKIGAGGMGTVYMCEHPLIRRRAALKVLHPEHAAQEETVERFFHEATAATEIGHENIVEVYDFGRLPDPSGGPDVVYLMMELLEGESLAHRLKHGELSFDETVHILRQCCSALAASHQKGIVHRDLKPENVFLCRRTSDPLFAKIVDFGIAKLLTAPGGGKTRAGTVLGTPLYMSPEQCQGRLDIDGRADVYSLGVMMYEMLTKRLPFGGSSFGQVMLAHLSQPPPPPSSVNPAIPRELEAIVLHCLEKDRAHRFQTMDELDRALESPAAHAAAYAAMKAARPAVDTAPAARTMIVTPQPATPMPTPAPAPLFAPTPGPPVAVDASVSAPRLGRRVVVGAIAGVLGAAALGSGLWLALRSPGRPAPAPSAPAPIAAQPAASQPVADRPVAPPPPVAPQPPPPAKPAVEWVTLAVDTSPPGATVRRVDHGDRIEGTTPLRLRLDKGSTHVNVRIELAGYVPYARTLATDTSTELVVMLRKQPDAPPAPPPRR